MKPEDIKLAVNKKYSRIAKAASCGCCGTGSIGVSMIGDEYNYVKGHVQEADLGLGCGIPTEFAGIKPGDSVLDLGSGAGNDCFVARAITGEKGKVTGLDFSAEMVKKARDNNRKLGFSNVGFIDGDIEEMPLPSGSYDVVLSNCVLNLVPDKRKAFTEIYRVLKPGGHFCISDVVLSGELPESLKKDALLYTGCVAGALQKDDYINIIKETGFREVTLHRERKINIPEGLLLRYLGREQLESYSNSGTGVFSITIGATK